MGLASKKEAFYACRPSGHLCLGNERINYFLSKRNTNYSVIILEGVTQKIRQFKYVPKIALPNSKIIH